MGSVAGRFRRASLEDVPKPSLAFCQFAGDAVSGGQDRIEDDAADALGMVAHERMRQVGAVGRPVDVPYVEAEHLAEVGEIGRRLYVEL